MTYPGFYNMMIEYFGPKMEIRGLDIWEIQMQVAEGGNIKIVSQVEYKKQNGKIEKKLEKTNLTYGVDEHGQKLPTKLWKRTVVNYASMGFDGRVGLGFDSKRTNTRLCNKAMYGWEGFKKICCTGGGPKMQNLIEKFEVIVDAYPNTDAIVKDIPEFEENHDVELEKKFNSGKIKNSKKGGSIDKEYDNESDLSKNLEEKQIGHWNVKSKTVFQAKISQSQMLSPQLPVQVHKKQAEVQKKLLLINPINLIILNVNSYAGGIKDMWNKANSRSTKDSISESRELQNQSSEFDGKLDFLSFKNRFYFGLCERGCTGGGMRIAQGTSIILFTHN